MKECDRLGGERECVKLNLIVTSNVLCRHFSFRSLSGKRCSHSLEIFHHLKSAGGECSLLIAHTTSPNSMLDGNFDNVFFSRSFEELLPSHLCFCIFVQLQGIEGRMVQW